MTAEFRIRCKPGTLAGHGTVSQYTNGACRCDLCRRALRDYMREYRATVRKLRNRRVKGRTV